MKKNPMSSESSGVSVSVPPSADHRGIVRLVNEAQPLKDIFPMLVAELSNVQLSSEWHSLNARSPMLVMEWGIVKRLGNA